MSGIQLTYKIEGFLKVYDPNNGEVFVDKHNAINYENMSEAIADTLSSRGYGEIYQMAFGNGGTSIDPTGIITYLTPNSTGTNASLYNQTFIKVVDDRSVNNTDPARNKIESRHVSGTNYTDIVVSVGKENDGVFGFIGNGSQPEGLRELRKQAGDKMIWTPGVNLATGDGEMGQRYGDPYEAVLAGSDGIIVGSGIHRANDPAHAASSYASASWRGLLERY